MPALFNCCKPHLVLLRNWYAIFGLNRAYDNQVIKTQLLGLFVKNWCMPGIWISGHSHGGQISFPFIGSPYYPYLSEKYPLGLNRISGTDRWVYTTRGIGSTVPVRFNCRPEVSLLKLTSV